jgi:hypothetical protein
VSALVPGGGIDGVLPCGFFLREDSLSFLISSLWIFLTLWMTSQRREILRSA